MGYVMAKKIKRRETKADIEWYCTSPKQSYIGPVFATIYVDDDYIPAVKLEDSLEDWNTRVLDEVGDRICKDSCQALNESVYCGSHEVLNIWNGFPKEIYAVPEDIIDRIERLEGLIEESKKFITKHERKIADLLAKGEKMDEEDRESLRRLDGYIRSEKENIRKYENEIRKLKEEWGVE